MHVLLIGWVERICGNIDPRPDQRNHNACDTQNRYARPSDGVGNIGGVDSESKEWVKITVRIERESGEEKCVDVDGQMTT
jgi:hypothetical protein